MSLFQAIVLGLVQGLTEFLPISSTAHLLIVPAAVGWPDPGSGFSAAIQLGTLVAVFVYFATDMRRLFVAAIESLRHRNLRHSADSVMAWAILPGTLPIGILGLLFKDQIDNDVRSLEVVSGALIALALALLLAERLGMVDSPTLSDFDFRAVCRRFAVQTATPKRLAELDESLRARSLILVQDAFTRYFETPVFAAFIELASRLGYRVLLAPYSANGKPLHVQGFLGAFARTARRNARRLQALANFGIPLVGLDPAMTLVYRQEYAKLEKDVLVQKALLQLLLQQEAEALIEAKNTTSTVQVLDPAVPPELKARPQRILIVFIAGVLSLFASICYTLGSVYVRAIRTRWTVEHGAG